MKCQRCGKDTLIWTLSMFNTQEICMVCKEKERQRPDYEAAVKADEAAIKEGNFNFNGIGLSDLRHTYKGLGNTICEQCGHSLNHPIHLADGRKKRK